MDKSGLQERMMGRGAKIFFLSALVAGCVFGLVSFLLISSLTSDGTAKAQNNGNMETVMTVFCLDECGMLCSIVKISVGEIVNIDFEIPDAKTAEVFCTRGYVAVLDGLGKSDYYAIVPHGAIGAIASKLGVPAPSSLTDREEVMRFSTEASSRLLKPDGDKIFSTFSGGLDTDLTAEALSQIIKNRKNIK